VSAVLFRRTLVAGRWRLLAVAAGLATWGFLLPVVYATFGAEIRRIVEGGYFAGLLDALTAIGGGSVFTLGGSVALSFIHPIPIALVAVLAIGHPVGALAGERQRGTLEVLLARPISRRRVYGTALAATCVFVVAAMAANLAGVAAGAVLFGVADELQPARLLLAWGNAVLFFATLGALALAASASFDRVVPALGIVLAFTIASYAVELLGALWPDMAGWRPWSFFHYFQPAEIMAGEASPTDAVVLGGIAAAAVGYALWIFPRRDLAAPS
jgi:ABC-type transport system involved in multi-copper enzyme maturation permease subunit